MYFDDFQRITMWLFKLILNNRVSCIIYLFLFIYLLFINLLFIY